MSPARRAYPAKPDRPDPGGSPRPGRRARAGPIGALLGWNALWCGVSLALTVIAGEVRLRTTAPFMDSHRPTIFHPVVGRLREPFAEIRHTNLLDFWTISRANSSGFVARELPRPPPEDTGARSCHLTVIGDSFVEALEVPIADKMQVQLERLAARELPDLHLTTSAFGRRATGQVEQLAYYTEFARQREPRIIVLVFVSNDFLNNSLLLSSLVRNTDPDHPPGLSARRRPDGALALTPPTPQYAEFRLASPPRATILTRMNRALGNLWFARWVQAKFSWNESRNNGQLVGIRRRLLESHPRFAAPLRNFRPESTREITEAFARPEPLEVIADALEATAFAFERFRRHADEIGAALVILATHELEVTQAAADRRAGRPESQDEKTGRGVLRERLLTLADAADIPVIEQGATIRRRGAELTDAHWRHDRHWNPAGHRFAAEAVLDWLKAHPSVCEARADTRALEGGSAETRPAPAG